MYVPTLIANILAIVGLEIIGNSYTRLEIYDSIFMISQDNQIQGPIWYIPFIFSCYLIFYIICINFTFVYKIIISLYICKDL